MSHNEKRIREITLAYYSSPEVRKAIFEFSQNRECIPRYYEGFGKRPDTFQYEGDILEQVKRGATSFHCSEEIWEDPLEISNNLSESEFDELRTGWDLLLDIDSPYLEYSKIFAHLLVELLDYYGVKNIGTKFSGSKGFHIIIPWKAFPEEIYGHKTKDMFPQWPRIICQFVGEIIKPKLTEKIFEDSTLSDVAKRTGKKKEDLIITECLSCKKPAIKKELVTWICPYCKNEMIMIKKNRRIPKCPNDNCRKPMIEVSSKEIFYCDYCNIGSDKNPDRFAKTREKTEALIDADLILVAPRHLFRMPYSLHEKTALSSIVIDKDKIKDFQILDAKPFKSPVKNFYLDAEPGEAKELLLQALDWKEQKDKQVRRFNEDSKKSFNQNDNKNKDFKKVKILNPTPEIYPPCINLILKGIKGDGRKRALFVLINFFRSIGVDMERLKIIISQWNERNYKQLKEGYIRSQLEWHSRNKSLMPPNCDKPNYKDIAVCKPDELCRQLKNPVNYAYKRYFRKRGK